MPIIDFDGVFFNTEDYNEPGKMLGEGSFGTVYLIKSKIDNKNYAVKIFNKQNKFNGQFQKYILRESMILNQLDHPAIIKFKGVNFESFKKPKELQPSIIFEYLQNGSLKEILQEEHRSLASKLWTSTKKYAMLLGISHAMNYLHKNGFIHRDLKPDNILVDENFYPRICDFGLY